MASCTDTTSKLRALQETWLADTDIVLEASCLIWHGWSADTANISSALQSVTLWRRKFRDTYSSNRVFDLTLFVRLWRLRYCCQCLLCTLAKRTKSSVTTVSCLSLSAYHQARSCSSWVVSLQDLDSWLVANMPWTSRRGQDQRVRWATDWDVCTDKAVHHQYIATRLHVATHKVGILAIAGLCLHWMLFTYRVPHWHLH